MLGNVGPKLGTKSEFILVNMHLILMEQQTLNQQRIPLKWITDNKTFRYRDFEKTSSTSGYNNL